MFPKLDMKDLTFYNACMVGNIHHILIAGFVVYNYMHLPCDWFKDEACMMTPFDNFRRSIMITCGYLIYDFIVIIFICDQSEKIHQQVFHHVLAVSGCMIGMHAGYGQASIGSILLLMEISTIFLNYRFMLSPNNFG
jgi:hypothetical protein